MREQRRAQRAHGVRRAHEEPPADGGERIQAETQLPPLARRQEAAARRDVEAHPREGMAVLVGAHLPVLGLEGGCGRSSFCRCASAQRRCAACACSCASAQCAARAGARRRPASSEGTRRRGRAGRRHTIADDATRAGRGSPPLPLLGLELAECQVRVRLHPSMSRAQRPWRSLKVSASAIQALDLPVEVSSSCVTPPPPPAAPLLAVQAGARPLI